MVGHRRPHEVSDLMGAIAFWWGMRARYCPVGVSSRGEWHPTLCVRARVGCYNYLYLSGSFRQKVGLGEHTSRSFLLACPPTTILQSLGSESFSLLSLSLLHLGQGHGWGLNLPLSLTRL